MLLASSHFLGGIGKFDCNLFIDEKHSNAIITLQLPCIENGGSDYKVPIGKFNCHPSIDEKNHF